MNFTGDPYLNNALNALVEVFAYFCIYFAVILGRRLTLSTGFVLAGVFCISSMLCDLYANGRWGKSTNLINKNIDKLLWFFNVNYFYKSSLIGKCLNLCL